MTRNARADSRNAFARPWMTSISSMDVSLRSRDSARAFDGLLATPYARARIIHGGVVASSGHGTAFTGVGVGTNHSTRVIHGRATG